MKKIYKTIQARNNGIINVLLFLKQIWYTVTNTTTWLQVDDTSNVTVFILFEGVNSFSTLDNISTAQYKNKTCKTINKTNMRNGNKRQPLITSHKFNSYKTKFYLPSSIWGNACTKSKSDSCFPYVWYVWPFGFAILQRKDFPFSISLKVLCFYMFFFPDLE